MTVIPDTARVYEQNVEALLIKAMKGKLSAPCLEELRAKGFDVAKLKSEYSYRDYLGAIVVVRRHVYKDVRDDAAAYRAMGQAMVDGFLETMMGKALGPLMRVVGPSRLVERLPSTFKSGNNYLVSAVTKLAERDYEFRVNYSEPHPAMTQGVLERAVGGLGGARGVEVTHTRPVADGDWVYRIRWPA